MRGDFELWLDSIAFPCRQGKNIFQPAKCVLSTSNIPYKSVTSVRLVDPVDSGILGPYNAIGSGLAGEFGGTAACLSISDRRSPPQLRAGGFGENPSHPHVPLSFRRTRFRSGHRPRACDISRAIL
jgi:hypothetical protein